MCGIRVGSTTWGLVGLKINVVSMPCKTNSSTDDYQCRLFHLYPLSYCLLYIYLLLSQGRRSWLLVGTKKRGTQALRRSLLYISLKNMFTMYIYIYTYIHAIHKIKIYILTHIHTIQDQTPCCISLFSRMHPNLHGLGFCEFCQRPSRREILPMRSMWFDQSGGNRIICVDLPWKWLETHDLPLEEWFLCMSYFLVNFPANSEHVYTWTCIYK